MKVSKLAAAMCVFTLAAAFGVQAETPGAKQAASKYSQRGQLVYQIVEKWGPHVQEAYHMDMRDWSRRMGSIFSDVELDLLQKAADARTFEAMNNALQGKFKDDGDGTVPQTALGDVASDLVFIPIAPCRILDTREAGGVIAANTTRDVDVTAVSSYAFQGGSNTNCSGAGAAGSFAAAAIAFTTVNPVGSGYITAYPLGGTRPLAATLNYASGSITSNTAIVQLDQGAAANELSVYSLVQTHLVADIVGYFINPQATALDCVTTANTDTAVAAGATANSTAPACAAGYTQTSTNCQSSTWQMPFVFFAGGTCSAQNNSGSAATLRSSRTCCRVPGR